VTIIEPDSLQVAILEIVDETDGQSNGSIEVAGTGGSPPYVYSINSSPFQTSNLFTDLPAGEYCVTVMDVNGCITECQDVIVQNLTTGVVDLNTTFQLYPNPATDMIRIEAGTSLKVELFDLHGRLLVMSDYNLIHQIRVADIVHGLYLLHISDGTGMGYRKVIIQ
jgi:hypothetical protein